MESVTLSDGRRIYEGDTITAATLQNRMEVTRTIIRLFECKGKSCDIGSCSRKIQATDNTGYKWCLDKESERITEILSAVRINKCGEI